MHGFLEKELKGELQEGARATHEGVYDTQIVPTQALSLLSDSELYKVLCLPCKQQHFVYVSPLWIVFRLPGTISVALQVAQVYSRVASSVLHEAGVGPHEHGPPKVDKSLLYAQQPPFLDSTDLKETEKKIKIGYISCHFGDKPGELGLAWGAYEYYIIYMCVDWLHF